VKLSLRVPRLEKLREALRSRAGSLRGSGPALPRREILIIAAAAVASAVITVVVLTVSYNAGERRTLAQASAGTQGSGALTRELSTEDFLLPLAPPASQPPDYYPFRPRILRWTRENVDKFWVSPRRIALDAISAVNDRNMESLFEKVK
jgi:hypothetical protein